MGERQKFVGFADEVVREAYDKLEHGRTEEKEIRAQIDEAIDDLKEKPQMGIRVPKTVWSKIYIQKYGITNLRKINLRSGWRLLYTIRGNEIEIMSVLLEWMAHKEYERRFKY